MRFARIGDSLYGYYATPFADIRSAAEYLNTLHSGICMGQMFGGRLKPDHSLAMFHDLARSAAAETPLSSDEALHYLRREDFAPQAEAAEGMNLMTSRATHWDGPNASETGSTTSTRNPR